MGEKVDLMNEENREQTGGKRKVYGEQGAHWLHNWRAHAQIPFSPQLWSSTLVAATLASLDMQSGPISNSVCRK